MDSDKYARSVSLMCPTCGHKDFEFEEGGDAARCTSCDRSCSRDKLIRENSLLIEAEVEDLKAELLKDVTSELRDSLKKAFRGSKHVTFK